MMRASATEQREFLLTAAAWQDSLLQNYRRLHVTIQGFLIATGAAVLAVQLTGAVQGQTTQFLTNALFNSAFSFLVVFLFWLQHKTASDLKGVIQSRAEDVSHWHRITILIENEIEPSQRAFTYFKMWQQAQRKSVDHLLSKYLPDEGLSEERAVELVGKGIGHTRLVLDFNLFERLQWLWIGILIISIGVTGWFWWVWRSLLPT